MAKGLSVRINYLDGIRGIAALLVFFNHLSFAFGNPSNWVNSKVIGIILDMLVNGKFSVGLFFIMSGYVLSTKYLDTSKLEPPVDQGYIRFVLSRLARLYLPFLFAVLLGLCFRYLAFPLTPMLPEFEHRFYVRWGLDLSFLSILREITFQHDLAGPSVIPQGWFLFFEINFNMLVPFLVWVGKKQTRNLILFGFVVAFMFGATSCLLYFISGILIAKYSSKALSIGKSIGFIGKMLTFLIGFVLVNCDYFAEKSQIESLSNLSFDMEWGIAWIGVLGIFLVIYSTKSIQKVLCLRPFLFFGKISYSFYLSHWVVFSLISSHLIVAMNGVTNFSEKATFIFASLGALVASFLFAIVFYYLIERPSHNLARRIYHLN